MASEIHVAEAGDVPEGGHKLVDAGGREVGIYRHKGQLYAFQNLCPHQGGPACEGLFMPRVTEIIDAEKRYLGQDFDRDRMQIVCPWHGWEFDVTTGQAAGDRTVSLIAVKVIEKQGKIYVVR